MEPKPATLRDRLLAHVEPAPDRLARYRLEVQTMIERHEATLRRQKWYAGGVWVFVVLLATTFLVLGATRGGAPDWFWPATTALMLLIGAAVELIKYFLNRFRVEVLKEIKGLDIQVRELKEQLQGGGRSTG